MITPSQKELSSVRYLRELMLNIIRETEGGGLDPNIILHFRLDWLHGFIARLVHLYGIDEEIMEYVNLTLNPNSYKHLSTVLTLTASKVVISTTEKHLPI